MWRKLTIIVVLLCLAGYATYEQFGHKEQAVKVKQEKVKRDERDYRKEWY